MRKEGQLPIPLQMAIGVASNEMLRRSNASSIAELEQSADALNEQARRHELEHNAAATNAFRHTQAQVVLRPGGVHPAFGYEVPVGNDQGMIRTAAVEMGQGMARDEVAFRKANMRKTALSVANKLGIGAGVGMAALGGAGVIAGKGIRAADKHVLQQPYANRQMKLGEALVQLHGGMDKEALGVLRSAYNAVKGGLKKGKKAFGTSRQAGGSVTGAASQATSAGGAQASKTYGASLARTPAPKIQAAKPGTGYVRKTPEPYRTPASKPVATSVEADPFPASKAPTGNSMTATTDGARQQGSDIGEGVARWGKKWIVDPVKKTARNPWTLAAGAGAGVLGYGGYQAAKAGIDTMQKHNPQYSYNQGGYQLPTSVGRHGYTQAPGIRY